MNSPANDAPDVRLHLPSSAWRVLGGVAALGIAAFLWGLLAGDARRAWGIVLVNFLFWSGLGHAGVLLSALQEATSARWGRGLKRIAEATCAFLPAAFVILLGLFAGIATWAPWVHEPVPARQAWLNVPFLIAREGVAFLLLSLLCAAFVYQSIRPDVGLLRESGRARFGPWVGRTINGWRGFAIERQSSTRWQRRLAPALLIVYALTFSLQSFDFVMSLDPEWISTLVGGYFFVGNLYIGLAFLAVAAVWSRSQLDVDGWVGTEQLHDVGKLLFGFCILWAYLVWSQYLVIWYGDLHEETGFVARRLIDPPWAAVGWTVFAAAFVIPFVILLSRAVKRSPAALRAIALVVLAGMWLERFLLVMPSLEPSALALGPIELLVTAGFASLFALCYAAFLSAVPVLPVSDPLLERARTSH